MDNRALATTTANAETMTDAGLANDLKEPVFTVSSLQAMLSEYRHQGSYVYQAAVWVRVPYVRSTEEIELETLLTHFAKNRQQDNLTLDEMVKLARFAYKNPKHILCNQVARLFHKINGTGRHYDILKLYLDKNLLTADTLSFLFASTSELRLSLHQFITEWNSDTPPLTQAIVEYAALIMLSVPAITSQQAILLLKALHHVNKLTLEKTSTLASQYQKQLAALAASLEIIVNYNKAHIQHPTDIDFAFLDERLQTGQLSADTPESLTLLAENQLLTKNIVAHFGTPALLLRLKEAKRLQEETLAKLQKNDEPVVVINTPPPPPPPLPTFKMSAPAPLQNKNTGNNKKPGKQKGNMPFLDELQKRIQERAEKKVTTPQPRQPSSSTSSNKPLSVEEMLRSRIEQMQKGLAAPKEEPTTEESADQPGIGW